MIAVYEPTQQFDNFTLASTYKCFAFSTSIYTICTPPPEIGPPLPPLPRGLHNDAHRQAHVAHLLQHCVAGRELRCTKRR